MDILVAAGHADDAAAALIWAGAEGVHIDELGGPDPALAGEAPPPTPPTPPTPALHEGMARLAAAWPRAAASSPDLPAAMAALRGQVQAALGEVGLAVAPTAIEITACQDGDWAQSWRADYRRVLVGQHLWVVPSWQQDAAVPPGDVAVVIDPGMAFGTGQHATTTLCLQAIEQFAMARAGAARASSRVLDVGCGTGILAIAAAKLGLGQVVAQDTDPIAVAVARDNAHANHVVVDVQVSAPAGPSATVVAFDLVVANILAGPLVAMRAKLLAQLRAGGTLVLSGLLAHQALEVTAAYLHAAAAVGHPSLRLQRQRCEGEWVALHFA